MHFLVSIHSVAIPRKALVRSDDRNLDDGAIKPPLSKSAGNAPSIGTAESGDIGMNPP